jgi:hypothetical protein
MSLNLIRRERLRLHVEGHAQPVLRRDLFICKQLEQSLLRLLRWAGAGIRPLCLGNVT